LTQGRISVAAIEDQGGNLKPMTWTSAARNYSPSLMAEKTALILLENEAEKNYPVILKSTVVERIDDFAPPVNIYIYI
jgi:hypothetical protein